MKILLADDQLRNLAVFFSLDEFPKRWCAHLGQFRVALRADLQQQVELAVADPVRLHRFCARPVPAAGSVGFASLHGQRHALRPLVAGDDVDISPGRPLYHVGEVEGGVAGGDSGEDGLLRHGLIEGFRFGVAVGRADAGPDIDGPDPSDLARVE